MDTVRFGAQVRALRRHRRWRQTDLAAAARTSRSAVSRLETGRADRVTARTLDDVVQALGARFELRVSWQGEALDRLLDADHARLVELVAAELGRRGWQVAVEVTFNIRGERGAFDLLAFHERTRTLLTVEVKSVVPDLQATLMAFDRKARVARQVAADRGWRAAGAGRVLVVRGSRTARRRLADHARTLAAAMPARTVEVRRWLASPAGDAFSGLWVLADDHHAIPRHRMPRRRPSARA